MNERFDVKFNGIVFGTASDWNRISEEEMIFHEFIPSGQFANQLWQGDLAYNYVEGEFRKYSAEQGKLIEVTHYHSLVKMCSCPA